MVPSAFAALDAMPLGPTGMIDRRALPAPEAAESGSFVVRRAADRPRARRRGDPPPSAVARRRRRQRSGGQPSGQQFTREVRLQRMEIVQDLWHLAFANYVEPRVPPDVEVQSEVLLTIEPQRADLLLLRRRGTERRDQEAQVFRGLWPRLPKVTVVEYKSPADSSFRPGDLLRLCGYGPQYHAAHTKEIQTRSDLALLLALPSITPTLKDEIRSMRWRVSDLGGGYRRITGMVYPSHIAVIDEVAEAERDAFLRIFSHLPVVDPVATGWLQQFLRKDRRMKQNIKDMPGYDEVFRKLIESFSAEEILAAYPPEQRLAGLPPEQRLAGLPPEQQMLALSDEVLRRLPDSYLQTLSPEVQEAIRRRVGRPAPAG
jgi:hypothetical protein